MSQKFIKFEIVTPERTVLKEEVAQVTVPTKQGEITVLPNHIPLVASLMPGVIEIKKPSFAPTFAEAMAGKKATEGKVGEREIISVSGGFIEVLKNKVVILADTAERAEEINVDRVEEARKQAEKTKTEMRHFDKERFVNISAQISKELARTRAVKRWKKIKKVD